MFLIVQFFRFRVADIEQYFLCFSSVSSTLYSCLWTKHCASCGFAFVNFLNPDLAECVRRCFFQCAKTCIPGCHRFHAAERARQGFDDNIFRYVNSPVMHVAVSAQHEPLLFHGGVPVALPVPTKSIRFLRVRRGTLHVERCWRQTPPLRGSVVPTRFPEQHEVGSYIRKELCAMSFCQVARPCSK